MVAPTMTSNVSSSRLIHGAQSPIIDSTQLTARMSSQLPTDYMLLSIRGLTYIAVELPTLTLYKQIPGLDDVELQIEMSQIRW